MELLEDPKLHDDAMRELYEASLNGCVSTLNTLIKKDPLILSRLSLYPFTETPLHIASLLGHLEFCQVLLQNSPNLATELDSKGRCPLHLASAKGHTEVVKALLKTKPETSLVRDKDDMLPLHFAAMRGRVGAIKELIEEKPNSIQEMIESDDGSVLHLCVRYNHLEALKLLVESLRGEHQFLSAKDKEDNTLLLSAVKHRQIKIIKYLLSLSQMSNEITTMDMLERCARDFMSQHILTEGDEKPENEVIAQEAVISSATLVSNQQTTLAASSTSSQSITIVIVQPDPPQDSHAPSLTNNEPPHAQLPLPSYDPEPPQPSPQQTNPPPPTNNAPHPPPPPASQSNGPLLPMTSQSITTEQQGHGKWNRFEKFCRTYLLDKGNWIDKKTREQLMVAATVIATMTFQSVISPPGGVWQTDTHKSQDGHSCPNYGFCQAGTVVVGYAWPQTFMRFVFFNSTSFFASLCVMLILMSGFPLENKIVMRILAVLMIVAASCMLFTYMWALGLVSPIHIYNRIENLGYLLVGTWVMLLVLVGLIQTSRIVFWARSRRKSSTNAPLSHIN